MSALERNGACAPKKLVRLSSVGKQGVDINATFTVIYNAGDGTGSFVTRQLSARKKP